MTPAAQYAAAIEILDVILTGAPAEKSLTHWARGHRFAGSKDRAAIRDHVYDVLRAKRSLGVIGGATDGRGLVLGLLRRDGIAPETVFGAGGYAPPALSEAEQSSMGDTMSQPEAWNLPDWLVPIWQGNLGADAEAAALVQQNRAGIFLRANLRRAPREEILARLTKDGVGARMIPDISTAIEVTENHRRIANSAAYQDGFVELQDTASQIAMLAMPVSQNTRVLDFCAGGGGKALALTDMYDAIVTAHDIAPQRLMDLPERARRAGVSIDRATKDELEVLPPFDVVLCDAPCSGSGTWRRTPEAKWALTRQKLNEYSALQLEVLSSGAQHVVPGGHLVYATCSVLKQENDLVVAQFLERNPDWNKEAVLRLLPTQKHDGFFMVVLHSPNTR